MNRLLPILGAIILFALCAAVFVLGVWACGGPTIGQFYKIEDNEPQTLTEK